MSILRDKDKFTNRLLAGDVEANGLLENVDKIWCIVSQDVETGEKFIFHDYPEYDGVEIFDPSDEKTYTIPNRSGSLIDGVRFWYLAANNGSKLIIHNSRAYDRPLLERFYPKFKTPDEAWHDTLIQSKIQWYDRPIPKGCKGQHGLQAYGARFGVIKPEVNDWSFMDAFKLHRCIQDNEIQVKTYLYLEKERKTIEEKLEITFDECFAVENEYRNNATIQELNGALVDQNHIEKCIIDLDEKIEILRSKIEPNLPPSVKPKSIKIGRSEMAKLMGYHKEVKDLFDEDGNVVKMYYKPSVNFYKTEKQNCYSGFHISYGESPVFKKKNELTSWIKENCPDSKSKEWDIEKSTQECKKLNANTCEYFGLLPEDTNIIVGSFTKVEFKESSLTQSDIVKSFLVNLGWKYAEEWNLKKDSEGNFVKADKTIEVRYPPKAAPENQMVKVVKKGEPIVTTPKLTDSDYESLPEGLGMDISHYNTYNHRRRFFENPKDPDNKGLKAYIRDNGRIPCGINNFATSTGRSSHSVWVNVAGDGSLYGEESRSTIIAPEGRILVGADMKSAQLSIAAYYANNKSYYDAVADGQEFIKDENGNDIYVGESGHCVNARAFTLVTEEEWKRAVETQDQELIHSISLRRKKSKGGSFATIFGASGKKVATTLDIPENLGTEKRNAFLSNIGLDNVIEITNRMVAKNSRAGGGYIELPFGYYAWCKAAHKQFNYLDQGTEAACQKWAVNYFEREAKRLGLDCFKILDTHDEYLVESNLDVANEVGELMCKSYEEASYACWEWHKKHSKWFTGNDLPSFTFNLNGGWKKGKTYYSVH